ncbi:MAG: HAMP domain-containing sensor histidine kinase [Odoribacter sp.]
MIFQKNDLIRIIYWGILCLSPFQMVWAQDVRESNPILIISSYNPETFQTSKNISEFLDEYKLLGGTSPVMIENMNCKSFSESIQWKHQMQEILHKYEEYKSPKIIILLGQEAWSSYLSQEDILQRKTPILCGMVSRHVILLPTDTINLKNWEPKTIDFKKIYGKKLNISGFAYYYDIKTNIQLIQRLYPKTRHIAFISDNSYGGVSMQAHVREDMKSFPKLDLILLDGRRHSIYTIADQISLLPENTVILIGTWRVDKYDSYFMRNATYSMMSANPRIPAFSLASVGLGHWTIGGYNPLYRSIGKDMAHQAIYILRHPSGVRKWETIPNKYVFDCNKLSEFNIDQRLLPLGADYLNQKQTFFEKYRYQIGAITAIFLLLVFGLILTSFSYLRTKRLKDKLQESEIELLAAKEKAEESDRLKSAFLANMSHEIRTPLNAIVGFSNVLVTENFSKEEQKEFVEVIQTNSDLLLRLIGDILDISRLETGRLKFTYEDCDVIGLCHKILATTSFSKKIDVEYVFETDMEACLLRTDVQRLQQVLINLVSNANKYTERGRITLAFQENETKDFLIFSVTDTGSGIPLEKQQKVFERFEKLDEYAQGTGLGLAICKLTVEFLGGKIWIDQNYVGGARFMFSHPIKISNEEEVKIHSIRKTNRFRNA